MVVYTRSDAAEAEAVAEAILEPWQWAEALALASRTLSGLSGFGAGPMMSA